MRKTEVHLHLVCMCASVYAHTCRTHTEVRGQPRVLVAAPTWCETGSLVGQGPFSLWPQSHHRSRVTDTPYCAWLYVRSKGSDSGPKLACYKFYPLTHISKPQAPHFLGQSLPLNLELTVPPRSIRYFTTELSPGNCTVGSNSALQPLRPTCLCLPALRKEVWNQAWPQIRILFSDLIASNWLRPGNTLTLTHAFMHTHHYTHGSQRTSSHPPNGGPIFTCWATSLVYAF